MLTVLAPFFTLSIWAAASGTSGNGSPTFTLLSWADADRHRHRAAARPAARDAKRTMTQLLGGDERAKRVGTTGRATVSATRAAVSSTRRRNPQTRQHRHRTH